MFATSGFHTSCETQTEIDPIVEALRRVWKATREFRLGRLVESQGLFQELEIDPYYVEDDEMLAALENWPNRFPMVPNGSGEHD